MLIACKVDGRVSETEGPDRRGVIEMDGLKLGWQSQEGDRIRRSWPVAVFG